MFREDYYDDGHAIWQLKMPYQVARHHRKLTKLQKQELVNQFIQLFFEELPILFSNIFLCNRCFISHVDVHAASVSGTSFLFKQYRCFFTDLNIDAFDHTQTLWNEQIIGVRILPILYYRSLSVFLILITCKKCFVMPLYMQNVDELQNFF